MKIRKLFVSIMICLLVTQSVGMMACAQGSSQTKAASTQEKKQLTVLEPKDLEYFFEDAVVIGDSVALGLSNYVSKSTTTALSKMKFLTAGGFGAQNALRPISKDSVHPVYEGEQQYVWDSVAKMEAKKVFLSFGMNDMNPLRNRFVGKYQEVIDKILETSPNTEIFILSVTPVKAGAEVGRINNEFIDEMNDELEAYAKENKYTFIDINTKLKDKDGGLDPAFCSDGFVHLSRSAYKEIWEPAILKAVFETLRMPNAVWVDPCTAVINTTVSCELLVMPTYKDEIVLMIPKKFDVQITGETSNGFYRANVGDGKVYYVDKRKAVIVDR